MKYLLGGERENYRAVLY